MSDDSSNLSDLRIETGSRARELPQEAHVRKRFGKFQDFIDEYSSRISLGGIFVDAEVLQPVGEEVYLDFRLEDGYRLLHGLGEVVWVRLKTMSEDRPKGMGVRFLSLDEGGRELVLKLLEEQVKSGGAPFEVDRVPEDGSIDPTVVQALAGPSDEENEAAHKAKTGSHSASRPEDEEDEEDEEDLPELPPGVLPPPDEEADFSAPWGARLPEIPDDLLDEPVFARAAGPDSAGDAAPIPSIPAVEAPESPYAPGSDSHAATDDLEAGDQSVAARAAEFGSSEAEQAGFEFEAPAHGEDPQLDESDFGAEALDTPKLEAVGGATDLQQAQDPFGDLAGEGPSEVDGTLFQLASDSPSAEQAATPAPSAADEGQSFTDPSFETDEPAFDSGGFAADGFGGFDAGGSGGGFDAELASGDLEGADFGDESSSQVAPPADIGDGAGAAWRADYDPDASGTGGALASAPSAPAQPQDDAPPHPSPQDSEAMDAAMGIESDDDGFDFEPPDEDLLQENGAAELEESSGWSTGDGTASGVAAGFDATHAAVSSFADDDFGATRHVAETPTPPASAPAGSPATDTADDLFAFRGPADARPAVDLEETASIRGSALPELSDTVMGTKGTHDHDPGDLTGSYDDWEAWAPHPTSSSGGRGKWVVGVAALLLVAAAGAGYVYRDTVIEKVMETVGLGSGDGTESAGPGPSGDAGSDSAGAETGPAEPDGDGDPLAEPVEGIDLDEFLDEGAGEPPGGTAGEVAPADPSAEDSSAEDTAAGDATADPPTTQADAASLRPPPPTGRESPPPPAPTAASRPTPSAASTGRVARRVESIQVRSSGPGTEVVVRFDGDLSSGRYTHDMLSWAADREMVTLRGIGNFEQTEIRGNTSELLRVRVGYHPGDELRLVFDKTSAQVAIRGIEARGNQLIIRLSA